MHRQQWLRFVEGDQGGQSNSGSGSDGAKNSDGTGTRSTPDSTDSGDGKDGDKQQSKHFTQSEVNALLASEKRKHQERYGDYDDVVAERDRLREQTQTEQEKAVREAEKAARTEAEKAARAGLLPQLQRAQAEVIALRANVGTSDQVKAWLDTADLARFADETGAVKETDLMAAMTAMWGGAPGRYDGIPGSGDSGRMSAWDSGLEEARRRFGGKQ